MELTELKEDLVKGLNPVSFVRTFLTPDEWQEKVLNFNGKRLILNCARQTGKSTITALLALHRGLYYSKQLILLVSPSLRQSSELFRKVSDYLNELKIKPKLIEDNKLSLQFVNKSRIVSLPSSESTIRGFSNVNLIIEDEASRVPDELYYTIRPMLAISQGRIILMSTPFGKRGHFFDEWTKGDWERIEVKATNCPRITKEFLASEKQSLGDWWFKQEYMCSFEESVDSVFKYEEIDKAFEAEVETWDM